MTANSAILDSLLGSRSKVRLLRVMLNDGAESTEAELARKVTMSPNTVNLALRDLVELGVVHVRKIGTANVHSLNKDSFVLELLGRAFSDEFHLQDELLKLIRKNTSNDRSVVLFGSYARNQATIQSDMGLLVIVDNKQKANQRLVELELLAYRYFHTPLSIIKLTPKELKAKWNKPYMKNVRSDGVLVRGLPLEDLIEKRE